MEQICLYTEKCDIDSRLFPGMSTSRNVFLTLMDEKLKLICLRIKPKTQETLTNTDGTINMKCLPTPREK